jgi:hypothetical protein
MNDYLV